MNQANFQELYRQFRQERKDDFQLDILSDMIICEKISQNTIYLKPKNSFCFDNFKTKYSLLLQKKLIRETKNEKIRVEVQEPESPNPEKSRISSGRAAEENRKALKPQELQLANLPPRSNDRLNANQTFQNYIVGENNRFAVTIAQAIANSEIGTEYNPFFLYGKVGLGKTHLLHAIGNAFKVRRTKVLYTSTENFFNDFLHSIRYNRQEYFKKKYRSIDVLLIDDIHDLQNKSKAQDEMFYIFNQLKEESKQLVFTCDRPASELTHFAERLQSRFKMGINAHLSFPCYEVRLAIIREKLRAENLRLQKDVVDLIAHNAAGNIRDLYGALEKVRAYKDLMDTELSCDIAAQVLREYFVAAPLKPVSIRSIQVSVADYYNLSLSDILGKSRRRNIVLPRQIAMYLSRELTSLSTTEIGAGFGNRNHTTILHGVQKVAGLYTEGQKFATEIEDLKKIVLENS